MGHCSSGYVCGYDSPWSLSLEALSLKRFLPVEKTPPEIPNLFLSFKNHVFSVANRLLMIRPNKSSTHHSTTLRVTSRLASIGVLPPSTADSPHLWSATPSHAVRRVTAGARRRFGRPSRTSWRASTTRTAGQGPRGRLRTSFAT